MGRIMGTNRKISETSITCPECNEKKVIYDREKGEMVCKNCGHVYQRPLFSPQGR